MHFQGIKNNLSISISVIYGISIRSKLGKEISLFKEYNGKETTSKTRAHLDWKG